MTRVEKCNSATCVNNCIQFDGGTFRCDLDEITIGADGSCSDYKSRENETGDETCSCSETDCEASDICGCHK